MSKPPPKNQKSVSFSDENFHSDDLTDPVDSMSDNDEVGPYMDALKTNLVRKKTVDEAGQLVVVSNDSTTKSPLVTDALGKNKQLPSQTEKQAAKKEALAKKSAEKTS